MLNFFPSFKKCHFQRCFFLKMPCDNVIDCLKAKGVNPTAYASDSLDDRPAESAIIYDENQFFWTTKDYQWWEVDFKRKVLIFSYSIHSHCQDDWIYNWKAEISSNRKNYSFVDQHSDTCGSTFVLPTLVAGRYFRITCTGKSVHRSNPHMAFFYVKFFGSISLIHDVSCNIKRKIDLSIVLMSAICSV